MTKAALRRQEAERQAREESGVQEMREAGDAIRPDSSLPRMEPPPPYDAPHLPHRNQQSHDLGSEDESGCLNRGPGRVTGCLNVSTGKKGRQFQDRTTM